MESGKYVTKKSACKDLWNVRDCRIFYIQFDIAIYVTVAKFCDISW